MTAWGSDRIRHPGLLPILAGKDCTRFVFGGEPEVGFKSLFHLKWGAIQQNTRFRHLRSFPRFSTYRRFDRRHQVLILRRFIPYC